MSTVNPTHIIADGMREVATSGRNDVPGTREDGQLWGAFPNTMTLKDLAAHVVSKLTDAGYSIIDQASADELAAHREDQELDRRWAARCDLNDLRCINCDLRYGERQDYACYGSGHFYSAVEVACLTAAAEGEKQ